MACAIMDSECDSLGGGIPYPKHWNIFTEIFKGLFSVIAEIRNSCAAIPPPTGLGSLPQVTEITPGRKVWIQH